MTGSIALTCAERDGRSYLSHIRYDGLSRVSRPQRVGNAAHVVLAHLGPGIIGGDRYSLDVEVEAGASLLLTGQMATPVFARGEASSLDTSYRVGPGATLIVRGEPVMLDARARHATHAALDIDGDGLAIVADILTLDAGAHASVRSLARIEGRLVARDACELQGIAGAVATIVVVCADAARRASIAASFAPIIARADGVRAGCGDTAGALVVRATSAMVWPLGRFVDAVLGAVHELAQPRGEQRFVDAFGTEVHDLRDVVVAR